MGCVTHQVLGNEVIADEQVVSAYMKAKEAGTNPMAALNAAEGLVGSRAGKGTVRILSAQVRNSK